MELIQPAIWDPHENVSGQQLDYSFVKPWTENPIMLYLDFCPAEMVI